MKIPSSPSKTFAKSATGRAHLRKLFLKGVLIGLAGVFALTALSLLFRRQDTVGDTKRTGTGTRTGLQQRNKQKLVAFVGVQSGFSRPGARPQYRYELRREVLRKTWFPSSRRSLDAFEKKTGIRVRFVIGHSSDAGAEFNLEVEMKRNKDIVQLDILEEYLSLPYKILNYLRYVTEHFDAGYIVKIDDDVYFRLDRLPHAIPQWKAKGSDYVGCMKRGEVFKKPGYRWREPQYPLLGDGYHTHVWGCAYTVSGRAAAFLSSIPDGNLRFLNNEDTTIGSWMLAFNVTYFDDRRFCHTSCSETSLVVYDYPKCAGLCEPHKQLLILHKDPKCKEQPDEIVLEEELIKVSSAKSRRLPPKLQFEGMAS